MTASNALSLTWDDRPGIVQAVTAAVLDVGGNIVENAQFTDPTHHVLHAAGGNTRRS